MAQELQNLPGGPSEVFEPFDELETDLLAEIASARWTAQPTRRTGTDLEAAVLLDGARRETMPKNVELVTGVFDMPGTYTLLSATSHSQRYGVMHGLNITEAAPGGRQQVGGSLLQPQIVMGMALVGLNVPTQRLGDWAGIDTTALKQATAQVAPLVGFG